MRCLVIGAVLAALSASAAAQNRSPDPASGPGCLGVTAETCVGWLRSTMQLDEGFIPDAMARRHPVDVNGKPLGSGGLVTLTGRLPGRAQTMVIIIHLRSDDAVSGVEASLYRDLLPAHTEAAYDATGFYDIVRRLLGRRCAGLARLDLYRFFENVVRPRIVTQREDLSGGLFGVHRVTAHAADVPYATCGVAFSYARRVEWHGSADAEAGRNLKERTLIGLK